MSRTNGGHWKGYKAALWDRGELVFPVVRVCCGWIFLLPFLYPPVPFSPVIHFLKEPVWVVLSSALQPFAETPQGIAALLSLQAGLWWEMIIPYTDRLLLHPRYCPLSKQGLSHCFHPYVCVGEAFQTVTFWRRDHVLCFFVQHLVQCSDGCQLLHLFVSVIGHFSSKRIVYASFTEF